MKRMKQIIKILIIVVMIGCLSNFKTQVLAADDSGTRTKG